MPISLHVLAPAFNLPSIDAESLAAIAYLRFGLPYGAWVLVADAANHGTKVSPFLILGEDSVEGLDAIVDYLKRISNGQWDLDGRLSKRDKTESFAMSSHLIQQFRPLVDLSLYCTAENYHEATRPAFSAGVGFPESWIIPPSRYSIAQERVQRLGLNTSDLTLPSALETQASESGPSQVFDEPSPSQNNLGEPPKPLNPKIAAQVAARKRLASLLANALDPLMHLLISSSESYLLGEHPCLADCHLLALSSLALVPKLPASFLADAIRKKYADRLDVFVRDGIKNAYGRAVTPEDALVKAPIASDDDDGDTFEAYENMDIGSGEVELPWRRPKPRSMGEVVGGFVKRAYGAGEAILAGT